ncbi:MAG: phenylalanine--tRNA ligase subunit beta [Actinomycetota bacterium]|nr:phenylalanine--tRNA ligase subunit beta [Actinomycetota bacterium]
MLAPLSWLRDFAPFDHPVDVLSDALSNLGLVVEGVSRIGEGLDGVVVARVLEIRVPPDAKRIRLVDVDPGDGQALQIGCGASNFAVGDLVPLATIGAVLPNGMAIARRKMLGEWSNGMLCAAAELGLPTPEAGDGLMILPPGLAPPGTPITEALALTPDVVFDLEISPNRPDALCMAGVARDLAAALGRPWAIPVVVPWLAGSPPATIESTRRLAAVRVEAPELCPRFTATVIEGVQVAPSLPTLARRLTLAGMRPINNVVDISNYVMLDLGQPNHAYDLDRLAGGGISVRRGHPGEVVTTLDGVARAVEAGDCLICDDESVPIGIGGIMGGASTEVSEETTTVLLEAAYFDPLSIARTGARLGLHSEAGVRFQHGIDPEIAEVAADRFVQLLAADAAYAGRPSVRRGPLTDVRASGVPGGGAVTVRTGRVNQLLGTTLEDEQIVALLRPIGFVVTGETKAGELSIRIPSWRPDSEREIDVIEEIARLHGYANIEKTLPEGARIGGGLTPYQRERRRVRDILVGAGLSEAWTTTFLAPEDLTRAGLEGAAVQIENPLDDSESILRTSMLPGLLKALRFNADRQQGDVRLFEIGRNFTPSPAGVATPTEKEAVAIAVAGEGVDGRWAAWMWAVLCEGLGQSGVELRAASVPGLHATRGGRLMTTSHDGEPASIGALGEVDAEVVSAFGLSGRIAFLEVDLEALLGQPRRSGDARLISRFPASDIDLAFVVPESVPAAAVDATLRRTGGSLLERLALFDVYRDDRLGPDRRSLAFRLRFRAPDRTLSERDLSDLRSAHINAVTEAHGGVLRG